MAAHQAPPSTGFCRQESWSGLPFPSPGDLPDPGIEPRSPALQADSLPSAPPGKPWVSADVMQTHCITWLLCVTLLVTKDWGQGEPKQLWSFRCLLCCNKALVSGSGVLCLLPLSTAVWQDKLLACKKSQISSYFLTCMSYVQTPPENLTRSGNHHLVQRTPVILTSFFPF